MAQKVTLSRPWPKGEWIVANYPAEIWPSRYLDMDGNFIDRKPREESTQ
ncbi:helix-turn-helix domain-containing protein [Xenorhabdus sp. Vera]|nr:helix-turn-helix domain-containing protein [Xenorhabdus sp. Vera]